MKVLALFVLYLSISKGYGQHLLASPKQYDFTTNIIEPISTNQQFNQYGFTPQSSNLPYPLPTAQTIKPNNQQNFNNQKYVNKPHPNTPKVQSTNIPVQASYQVADYVLVPSGAHAYPVQHSVEITHRDYHPFANVFVEQFKEPSPKQGNQNAPPITRPLHPQFATPIRPQQTLKPYNTHNGFKPYVANSQNVNIRGPQLFKSNVQNPNVIRAGQKLLQQSTPPNLPYNFKAVPTVAKPSHRQQQNNLVPLDKPSGFVPKPLPSPLQAVPLQARGKDSSKEDEESKEQAESKPVKEEEDDDESDEDDESEESDEDEESDEEESSEEKDYTPKYSYNRPVNTEFDKRNYRPTFDAAKYIFNENNSNEDDSESEEEDESRERRPPPKKEEPRNSYREQPRHQQVSYGLRTIDAGPKRPEKNVRGPQQRRVSREQLGKGTKFVQIRENPYRKRYKGYYEE